MDNFIELFIKKEKLPGRKISHSLKTLENSRHIVDKNFEDLIKQIALVEADPSLWDNHRRYRDASKELLRFIHNYLSGVYTLEQHIERLKEYLDNKKLNAAYDEKLNDFANNPKKCLLHELRTYAQHYGNLPCHVAFRNLNTKGGEIVETRTLELDTTSLLRWKPRTHKKWETIVVPFMEKNGTTSIRDIVIENQRIIESSYHSFYELIEFFYQKELQEYFKVEQEIRKVTGKSVVKRIARAYQSHLLRSGKKLAKKL